MRKRTYRWLLVAFLCLGLPAASQAQSRWPEDQANRWSARHRWLVGCNFIPNTAINQLEMWQSDSFDPATIDRELGWAEDLGFTSIRVFLHNLLWEQDSQGFLSRLDRFLTIADRHHLGTVFVLFDSCWDPFPRLGKQRAPRPFVHNSGWVQSPGKEILMHPEKFDELKPYVQGVIRRFRNDPRVDLWDLFNEPDNLNDPAYLRFEPSNKKELAQGLLQHTFEWARECNPTQPLSSGVWQGNWPDDARLSPMERVQLFNSDVITFHNYGALEDLQKCVENLKRFHRPVVCTEYMARPAGSTFDPNLTFMHDHKIGAYNWGFVSGKTQTIYPWDSWTKTYTSEPPVWFHDIFHSDGTPYHPEEVHFIKGCIQGQTLLHSR